MQTLCLSNTKEELYVLYSTPPHLKPVCTLQQTACRYSGAEITMVMHDLRDAAFSLLLMSLTLLHIQEHCTSYTIIMKWSAAAKALRAVQSRSITNVFTSSQNCSFEIRSTQTIQTLCRCGLKPGCDLASCSLYSSE